MTPKSDIRCPTPRCISDIANYGEHYHSVYPKTGIEGVDASCERCGGKHLIAGGWRHVCKQCGVTVQPGELAGLFVPHSCAACIEKNRQADIACGAVCRSCRSPYTDCCC